MIRHLVALKFQGNVTQEQKETLYAELRALDSRIAGIMDFQYRQNVSVEDHVVRGFRDMFWFDFRDRKVRDAYLADTEHQAIGARLVEHLDGGIEGVFVMDIDL